MLYVKFLRIGRELSQHTLGMAAGIDQSTIGQLESGRLRPNASQKARLAAALGVPAGLLFKETKIERPRGAGGRYEATK